MPVARPALVLALSVSLAAAGAASAVTKAKPRPKPKPVCNLIADVAGDASLQPPAPSDDSLDVLSADVATNATTLTAVLRLKNLSGSSAFAHSGVSYELDFTVPTAANTIFLSLNKDDSGSTASYGDIEDLQGQSNNVPKGAATAVFDTTKNEVRISAKVADLSSLGKLTPGTKVSGLEAKTWVLLGTPEAFPATPLVGPGNGALEQVDDATGSKAYVAGYPSCVTPGT